MTNERTYGQQGRSKTTIIGHHKVVAILEDDLPPVALLAGPASIGKWTLATHLADHHRIGTADRSIWPDGLRIDNVRVITAFAATAPLGAGKLIQARLDGSTVPALNALLKILEQPPPDVRFLLTASRPTLPTIISRAQVFRCGLLDVHAVHQILVEQGVSPAAARTLALLGRGQVRPALDAERLLPARTAALTAAKTLTTGDRELFDQAFASFDEAAGRMLRIWLEEAYTGQHRWYTPAETAGFSRDKIQQMIIAVGRFNHARAGLCLRAALQPFLPD